MLQLCCRFTSCSSSFCSVPFQEVLLHHAAPQGPQSATRAASGVAWSEGMSTTKHNDVILTIAEEKELALMDADGDDRISAEEARAAVKSSAKLSVSTSRLWKIVFGVIALLFLAWLGHIRRTRSAFV